MHKNPPEHMCIKVNREYHRLYIKDILYIKGMENYVVFYTGEKNLTAKATMIWCENNLPESQFIRIHKSYIINREKVGVFNKGQVTIGEHIIPISRQKRDTIFEQLIYQ